MSFYKFAFNGFPNWIFFYTLFCISSAALKSYYVEDLCVGTWYSARSTLFLRTVHSGILSSVPTEFDSGECVISLTPEPGFSVVLSVSKFQLSSEDRLTITDSDDFKVALIGKGDFPDERKSFSSDGTLTIHYAWNNTRHLNRRVKFQFVFTQVHKYPCRYDEFECRNKKCLYQDLACNRHNHCGDNSNQEACGQKFEYPEVIKATSTPNAWLISIIVCSVILAIIIIVFIVLIVRGGLRKKNKQPQTTNPSLAADQPSSTNHQPLTVTATVPQTPTAPLEEHAPPTMFGRFRQSLRGLRSRVTAPPEESKTDKYEVPSMYPQLPATSGNEESKAENHEVPSVYPNITSAPHLSGIDNPEFKSDI